MSEPEKKQVRPFIIMKCKVTAFGQESPGYEKITTPYKKPFLIERQQAFRYIEKYNMEVVFKEDGCKIWEMKGRPFFNKYKGYFGMKEKINYICNTKENEEENRK